MLISSTWQVKSNSTLQSISNLDNPIEEPVCLQSAAVSTANICEIVARPAPDEENTKSQIESAGEFELICSCNAVKMSVNGSIETIEIEKISQKNVDNNDNEIKNDDNNNNNNKDDDDDDQNKIIWYRLVGKFDLHPRQVSIIRFKFNSDSMPKLNNDKPVLILKQFNLQLFQSKRLLQPVRIWFVLLQKEN